MEEMKYTWPYANEAGQEEVIESDVLVLGGGLAGCFAAIAAASSGLSVALVEKGAARAQRLRQEPDLTTGSRPVRIHAVGGDCQRRSQSAYVDEQDSLQQRNRALYRMPRGL